MPNISLYGTYYLYGYDYEHPDRAFSNLQRASGRIGIGMQIPIFQGFSYFHEMEILSLQLRRLNNELALAKRRYDFNQKELKHRIAKSVELFDTAEEIVSNSKRNELFVEKLRKNRQMDAIAQISRKIALYRHRLDKKKIEIEHYYELMRLKILSKGVDECSLR